MPPCRSTDLTLTQRGEERCPISHSKVVAQTDTSTPPPISQLPLLGSTEEVLGLLWSPSVGVEIQVASFSLSGLNAMAMVVLQPGIWMCWIMNDMVRQNPRELEKGWSSVVFIGCFYVTDPRIKVLRILDLWFRGLAKNQLQALSRQAEHGPEAASLAVFGGSPHPQSTIAQDPVCCSALKGLSEKRLPPPTQSLCDPRAGLCHI